jgi:hypothetical protein
MSQVNLIRAETGRKKEDRGFTMSAAEEPYSLMNGILILLPNLVKV